MCKNSENGEKLPISTKYAVEKWHGPLHWRHRASRACLRWLVVRLWHGPIAATCAGLWCDFKKRHQASVHGTTVASSRCAV